MPRLTLTSGAYQARSVIAAAQRSLNLIAEPVPQETGEEGGVFHYPTPGLTLLGTMPQPRIRGIKQATTGGIYAVAGSGVYRVDPTSWTGTHLGDVTGGLRTPVSMQDNGATMVIVDGTSSGWTVDLATDAFAAISSSAFYGADKVDFLDTYLLFNKPGTPQFYSSNSEAVTFDPLWFANKESYSDLLVTLAMAMRQIWLLGDRTTEIWYNTGASDFPFAEQPGTFIDHGCCAKYSPWVYDNTVFWLSRDRAGQGIVLAGSGNYQARKISTFALEAELTKYPRIDDAVGMGYSLGGHVFYVIAFPAADTTWVFDVTISQWHEWKWLDVNGVEHRHRANCMYFINDKVVCGDWQNGNLYHVDPAAYTDNGQPIKRQRAWPHVVNEGNRVFYRQFLADIESGNPAEPPGAAEQTLLSCGFTANAGTLLGTYSNAADTNGTWTLVSGPGAAIEGDEVSFLDGGITIYRSVPMSVADYTFSFDVRPAAYDAVTAPQAFGTARYTGPGTGYTAMVSGDHTQYWLTLEAAGGASSALAMGTLPEGFYTVIMMLRGSQISVSVQRFADELWLRPEGLWTAERWTALSMTDATYTAPGYVVIGGTRG